jgi:hypothetical protein
VHSASVPSMDHRHVASSSIKHVVDGSWNTQEDISSVKVFVVLTCKQSFVTIRSIINDYN